MSWDNTLRKAEYAGIQFDVQQTSDDLTRRVIEYKFPYVDGAELEDRGREPRTTSLTAVFKGPDYENDLSSFMSVVDRTKNATFHHPLLGTWKAKVRRLSITHENSKRDMAMVEIEVIEDGTRTSLPTLFSVQQLNDDIATEETLLLAAGDDLPPKLNKVDVTDALDDIVAAVDALQDAVDDAVATVDNAINDVRSAAQNAIDKVRNLYASTVLEAYSVVKRVNVLVHKSQQLAESATSVVPTLVEKTIETHQNAAQIAHDMYGDATRATEFEELNRLRHPGFIPPGTTLRIYSE